jgi:hypothetical protein
VSDEEQTQTNLTEAQSLKGSAIFRTAFISIGLKLVNIACASIAYFLSTLVGGMNTGSNLRLLLSFIFENFIEFSSYATLLSRSSSESSKSFLMRDRFCGFIVKLSFRLPPLKNPVGAWFD